MTTTPKGNSAIFLAVDMFTGYVQLKPLKSRKTDELIEAVNRQSFCPSAFPNFFVVTTNLQWLIQLIFTNLWNHLVSSFYLVQQLLHGQMAQQNEQCKQSKKQSVLSLNKKTLKIDGMIICISSFPLTTNQLPFTDFPPSNYILDWERGELPIILVQKRQQRARKSLEAR